MSAYSVRRSSGPVLRSISPSSGFSRHNSTSTPSHHHLSSSPFASATSSAFSSTCAIKKPTSARTHLNLYNYTSPSLSFSSGSQNRSISVSSRVDKTPPATAPSRRSCMCSPTNHPGSFRCSLHKSGFGATNRISNNTQTVSCGSSSRLNMRRSAMKNSLVRIGTVEGELVKRALAALIRPSSHQQRRRGEFRKRRSRLAVMSKA